MKVTQKDYDDLGWACKMSLLFKASESKNINEHYLYTNFREWIKNLTTDQAFSLTFENKYYTLSEQKIATPKIRAKERGIIKALKYYSVWQIAGIIGGLVVGTAGGVGLGSLLGIALFYLYRRSKDICHKQCKSHHGKDYKRCLYSCNIQAAKKVLDDIYKEMPNCSKNKNPDKCKMKLLKQGQRWRNILNKQKEKLINI
jgi:hypothetical protein